MVGEGRFEAVDDLTVAITCSAPALTLPDMMAGAAQPAIITTAACCTDEDANGYLNQYIGTGPYKFVEWKQDQYIKLEKFEDYCPYYLEGTTEEKMDGWGGYKHAYTKTLYIDKVAETATRVAGLQSGDYDVIWGVGSENTPMVEADPNLTLMSEQAGTLCMVFNKDPISIASNNDIRRAVNAVANCADLMASAFGTDYDLGSCYMDDLNAYWVTDAGKENYNLCDADKAKAYLESAGYNGETFTILAPTLNNYNNIGLVLQEELKSIGMNAELTTVDWATFMEYRKDPSVFDIYITSFASVPLPSLKAYYGPSYPGWTDDAKTAELMPFPSGRICRSTAGTICPASARDTTMLHMPARPRCTACIWAAALQRRCGSRKAGSTEPSHWRCCRCLQRCDPRGDGRQHRLQHPAFAGHPGGVRRCSGRCRCPHPGRVCAHRQPCKRLSLRICLHSAVFRRRGVSCYGIRRSEDH